MLHAQHPEGLHRLRRVHEGGVRLGDGGGGPSGEGGIHPQTLHVPLEIPELGVDEGIADALFIGDVVQLAQDDVEGLRQGRDPGDLPAVGAPVLLHPEVGVDEGQALGGQIVQLQVPDRVVGGYVAHVLHVAAKEPEIGIIVVEIGHPFPGAAAELADIMSRRAGGHQGQVDGHSRPLQVPGRADGHVVDPGDVLQGPPGGGLQAQAHHFIDVLPAVGAEEEAVAVLVGAAGQLVLLQQRQVPHGVRGQHGPLGVKKDLEEGEEEDRPRAVGLLSGEEALLGKHGLPGEVVGKGNPALLRLRGQPVQLLPAQGEGVGAQDAPAVEQGDEPLEVILLLQQLPQQGPVGSQAAGRRLGGDTPQQRPRHLADSFFIHGGVLLCRLVRVRRLYYALSSRDAQENFR